MPSNVAAQAFWRKVISEQTRGEYVEVQITEGWWHGQVQQFHVRAAAYDPSFDPTRVGSATVTRVGAATFKIDVRFGAERSAGRQRVLHLTVTIERPQSCHKNQVAGLRSPVGTNFVPQGDIEQSKERPFEVAVLKAKAVLQFVD